MKTKKKRSNKSHKKDGETQVPLEGITFVIKDSKGNEIDRVTTDSNGESISKKIAIDEKYTVYEEKNKERLHPIR